MPRNFGAAHMNPGHYGNITDGLAGIGAMGVGIVGGLLGAVAGSGLKMKDGALYGAIAGFAVPFVLLAPKKDDAA